MTVKVTLNSHCPHMYSVLVVKSFARYTPTFFNKVGKDAMRKQASGTGLCVIRQTPYERLKLKQNPN